MATATSQLAGGRDGRLRRIGRTLAALSVLLSVVGTIVLLVLGRGDFLTETGAIYFAALGLGFGSIVWIVIPAQPRNGAIWALAIASACGGLLVAGVAATVMLGGEAVAGLDYEAVAAMSPAMLPLPAALAIHFRFWAVVPALWLPLTFGLLLFPDGRVPSARWKYVGWSSFLTIVVATVATAIVQHPRSTLPIAAADNTLPGPLGVLSDAAVLATSVGAVLSLVSLVRRYRSSDGSTRSQIRWIGWGGAAFLVLLSAGPALPPLAGSEILTDLVGVIGFSILTVSYWIAITRHRLYDIDVIVSKSVTYLGLAAFITVLYGAVVVAPLFLFGRSDGGEPGLALPIVATAIVAVLFEPARSRLQRVANRMVYGERATPHEVLSRLTARLSDTSTGQTTSDLAKLLVDGTGAIQAVVWLQAGDALQPAGSWPPGEPLVEMATADAQMEDEFCSAQLVVYQGDVIGALTITKARNDPVSHSDRQLLSDVAGGATLLLRNIRLNRQLEERAEQLRDSRRRLIAAQDSERHRLERDLHDGAQQQVVALKVKLGIARTIAEREGAAEIVDRVATLSEETQQAVDALRAVAHGIYPPLLEADGLAAALGTLSRSSAVPIDVEVSLLGRYERSVEETVYFCVSESVVRSMAAGATRIGVTVRGGASGIDFVVRHDAMAADLAAVTDRVDAFGGSLDVSGGAEGSIVNGHVSLPPEPSPRRLAGDEAPRPESVPS